MCFYEIPKIVKFIETKNRMVVARRAESKRNWHIMGTNFHFSKMKRVLHTDGGDSYRILRMYLMPQNCTLKNDENILLGLWESHNVFFA